MVGLAARAGIGVVIVELCGREIARRSLLRQVIGIAPEPWWLVGFAAVAAVIAAARLKPGATERASVVFAVLFTAGVAAQLQLGARLQSDGFYYFAYLRSLTFDGDVNFTNDYKLLGLGDKTHLFQPTPTGYAQSAWTIGPAIVWAPFFAAGHVVATRQNATNPDVSANGISYPYRQAVCIAGLFYGLLGCWFCYRLTTGFYEARLAGAATALVVMGSFMLWYLVKEPSMTHAPSMAAVAGFVWAWLSTREARTMRQWALLGVLAGFMSLIRWQNGLFALLPACDAIAMLVAGARRSDRSAIVHTVSAGALFTACATVAFLPQMIAWHAIYGTWFAVSPVGPQIRWSDPHLSDILWSSRNGLFSWSPVLYPAAIGLVLVARLTPSIGIPALAACALMIYFNACIQDWWGSAGFGGRRFDGLIPLFSLGLAAFGWQAAAITRRHPLRVVAAAGAVLVVWNLTLMSAAQDSIVRIGEAMSFGDAFAAQARAFHSWFGNPFTYPASLGFAIRNQVPPAQYDLLSANRFLGDPLRPYGRVDIGGEDAWLIGDGWHEPERDGAVTFRWASMAAEVVIPLDHAASLVVQIRLHAFTYPGAPPQTLGASLNGVALSLAPVREGWETIEIPTDAARWHGGVNRLRLEFGWARRPIDVGMGGDARPLAAAVDYVRVEVR
jgi:hypothetical protein